MSDVSPLPPPGSPPPPPAGLTPTPPATRPPAPPATRPPTPPPAPPPAGLTPPPGHLAYGPAPTAPTKLSRIKGLATAIAIMVAVGGVGNLALGLLQFQASDKADQFLAGSISEDEFTDAILGFTALQGATAVASIATGVLVMIWMYRIAANLRAYGVRTTWHPLFAIFGWFIPPFALYIVPLLMLREQWIKSRPAAGPVIGNSEAGENVWLWAWFVLFGIIPAVIFAVQIDSIGNSIGATSVENAAENLSDLGTIGTIGSFSAVAAAMMWWIFVRQLTSRHSSMTGES